MNFEDALSQMKAGKKITHPSFEEDVYFQTCEIGFNLIGMAFCSLGKSIVKMKGEFKHLDMGSRDINDILYPGTFIFNEKAFEEPCKHGYHPQLNLHLVMSDEWEIYADKDEK